MNAGTVTAAAPPTFRQHLGVWLRRRLPISRGLFDQLRLELNAVRCKVAYLLLPWRRARLRAVRASEGVLVNVACGPHVADGFLNVDLIACAASVMEWDCRKSLPLGEGTAVGIRVEHFVEHLDPRDELPAFLESARRALRPGGVLRIIVPDAERYLRAYCGDGVEGFRALAVPEPFPDDLPTRMDVVNHVFHQWQEHRWGYDFETLAHRLTAAGFSRVERSEFGRSLHPALACDRPIHAPYSLYVDAVR